MTEQQWRIFVAKTLLSIAKQVPVTTIKILGPNGKMINGPSPNQARALLNTVAELEEVVEGLQAQEPV